MKLLFELRPVDHLEASVEYYRELGLEPLAWPDDETALLGPNRLGTPTIALVRDPVEGALGPGAVYEVAVDEFFTTHPDLDWLLAPADTPLGRYAVIADRTGTALRLLDPNPHLWPALTSHTTDSTETTPLSLAS